jgi:phage N-6-adenine-methyltransferase
MTKPLTDDIRLETIAQEIERLQGTAILQVAERLAEAHEIFRYQHDEGGFQGWVERRLTFSRRTAYKLLDVHKQFGGKESVHIMHTLPRSVLYLLAAPSTPPDARDAVLDLAANGEHLTHAQVKDMIAVERARGGETTIDAAKRVNVRTLYQGNGYFEWFTPAEYIALARAVLGAIDLDPATHEQAQRLIGATRYFTKDDDGLAQEWHGRVWLNPPYAQPAIAYFISKLCAERKAGRITAAIALTHNYTDTAWFHEAADIADAICFMRGRVKFYGPNDEIAAPAQGQAFFYFGDAVPEFIRHFCGIGLVLRRADGDEAPRTAADDLGGIPAFLRRTEAAPS